MYQISNRIYTIQFIHFYKGKWAWRCKSAYTMLKVNCSSMLKGSAVEDIDDILFATIQPLDDVSCLYYIDSSI